MAAAGFALRRRRLAQATCQPISPLVGEMSGRTEGGTKGASLTELTQSTHFTFVRSLAWIGAFSHRPSTLASQTPIFGSSNRKPLTASSARIFCACLKSSVRLASSEVRFSSSMTLSKAGLS